MKKIFINAMIIIAFLAIYLLQVNLFSHLTIARNNAKYDCYINTIYWIVL